jgi:hypothetical protein
MEALSIEIIAIEKLRKGVSLTNTESLILRALASLINDAFPEGDCEDSGDKCEDRFSIKSACRNITRELQNHSGELTGSEKKHLLEMIEAAAKVMQFY